MVAVCFAALTPTLAGATHVATGTLATRATTARRHREYLVCSKAHPSSPPLPSESDALAPSALISTSSPSVCDDDNGGAERQYESIDWHTVTALAARIVSQASGGGWDCILAVTRGGLTPPALVAEGLGVRNVLAATVMFYSDEGHAFFGLRTPRFLAFPPAALLRGRRVLVVDDVWDSGRTASAVRERVRRAQALRVAVAVLHWKGGPQPPDFYADTTDRWVLYPWEVLAPAHRDTFSSAPQPDTLSQ